MRSILRRRWRELVATALAGLALSGCAARPERAAATLTWYAGRTLPAFDPDGPPDALRVALERHLSRGLLERDAEGRVVPGIADSIGCSADSLAWTFRLAPDVRFTDGARVTSADLRAALVGGLAREDHGTRAWLLDAVAGVGFVRAGRPLPALGIETPDERTLRLRLAVRDPRLLERLAVPGVTTPWKRRSGGWSDAVGVGPYRLLPGGDERNLALVASRPVAGLAASVDTLRVRFGGGAARARSIARHALADVVWPVPQALLEPLPGGWELHRAGTRPARELLLVLRADVPPLTRLAARERLAGVLRREELLAALGGRGGRPGPWPAGASADFPWPRLESAAGRHARLAPEARLAQGVPPPRRESYHLVLAYDRELAGAAVAGVIQADWERAGHYVELRALQGSAAAAEALRPAAAQAQLVEAQALLEGTAADAIQWRMPARGPAVGSFRTGWRAPLAAGVPGARPSAAWEDADALQALVVESRVVLPLARLPWLIAVRKDAEPPIVHPAHGPEWVRPSPAAR
jgi:hypothetical protein